MDWCDIREVKGDEIIIRKERSKNDYHVKGIKITPHNIFLDDETTIQVEINKLRIALNKLPFKIYWSFVTSPVNIDEYKLRLYELRLMNDSIRIQNMISDDYRKAEQFEEGNNELEFMLFVIDRDEKILEKNYQGLLREINNAGLIAFPLGKKDYLNYVSYIFENPLISSIYFSRGIFEYANEEHSIVNDQVQTNKIDSDKWYDSATTKIEFATEESVREYKRSKMVPTSFIVNNDYMIIGDKYICMIQAMALPETYSEGLLCWYLNRQDIKVLMTTEKIDMDIARALKKDMNDKLDEYHHTTSPQIQHELQLALETNERYLDRIVRNNDITLNTTIIFMVMADSLQDLQQKKIDVVKLLEAEKFKVQTCKAMQEQALRYVCPVLMEGNLPIEIEKNYGIPLPSEGIAGLYPFVYETLKDNEGFFLAARWQIPV